MTEILIVIIKTLLPLFVQYQQTLPPSFVFFLTTAVVEPIDIFQCKLIVNIL